MLELPCQFVCSILYVLSHKATERKKNNETKPVFIYGKLFISHGYSQRKKL